MNRRQNARYLCPGETRERYLREESTSAGFAGLAGARSAIPGMQSMGGQFRFRPAKGRYPLGRERASGRRQLFDRNEGRTRDTATRTECAENFLHVKNQHDLSIRQRGDAGDALGTKIIK